MRNLEGQRIPTVKLLSQWNMAYVANGEAKKVGDLIEFLKAGVHMKKITFCKQLLF